MLATLARRLYFLLVANFHWVGTAAVALGVAPDAAVPQPHLADLRRDSWRRTSCSSRWSAAPFSIATCCPSLPILFGAFAAALSVLRRSPRRVATAAAPGRSGGVQLDQPALPLPFRGEPGLRRLPQAAPRRRRLHRPLVCRPGGTDRVADVGRAVAPGAGLHSPAAARPDPPGHVRRVARPRSTGARPRSWWCSRATGTRAGSLAARSPSASFWDGLYGFVPNVTPEESRARVPFPVEAAFTRRGQWVDIYVNPDLPRLTASPARSEGN